MYTAEPLRKRAQVALLLLGSACALHEPQPGARTTRPVLQASEGRWYARGLSPTEALLFHRGTLFAAEEQVVGTTDSRYVAVLHALGPPPEGSRTAELGVVCQSAGTTLSTGLTLRPLDASANLRVGACLATIVKTGGTSPYVVLNIGTDDGLQAGDRFAILGRAVVQEGFVPLGLDTDRDGLCIIPSDPTHLGNLTARCMVTRFPSLEGIAPSDETALLGALSGRRAVLLPRKKSP